MTGWQQYVLSVIICILCNGIVSQITSDTKGNSIVSLASSIVLVIVILRPITQINIQDQLNILQRNELPADCYIADGEKKASETKAEYIKSATEAYILDKAKMLGGEITALVQLDDNMVPVSVEIGETGKTSIQMQMETILAVDLGIPKEHQRWIWNQEDNSS